MTAVKCWPQSDLMISHLPFCAGLHIVLKYVLYNQLDRKHKKEHKTRKRKEKEKNNKYTLMASIRRKWQTYLAVPLDGFALLIWDGRMFDHLKVYISKCFYFVCLHIIYMFVGLSSWSTRTWSRMVTLCAGSSFPNKTGISTSPRNFGLQNILLMFFDGNIIIFLLWNLDQTLRQIQSASILFSCCSQRHNLLISPKRPSYLFSADAIYGMED